MRSVENKNVPHYCCCCCVLLVFFFCLFFCHCSCSSGTSALSNLPFFSYAFKRCTSNYVYERNEFVYVAHTTAMMMARNKPNHFVAKQKMPFLLFSLIVIMAINAEKGDLLFFLFIFSVHTLRGYILLHNLFSRMFYFPDEKYSLPYEEHTEPAPFCMKIKIFALRIPRVPNNTLWFRSVHSPFTIGGRVNNLTSAIPPPPPIALY